MKTIHRPRGMGKTTDAIKLAAESFSYIVCINREEAMRVNDQAIRMGLSIPHPITMEDLILKKFHPPGVKGFVIDNAEFLLFRFCGRIELKGITITGEPE